MAEKLRIAMLQEDLVWENIRANKEQFEKKIRVLSSTVDLVILPEMFTTGFSMNAEELAEPTFGPSYEWMKKMAREKDAAITGSIITEEEGAYFNRLYFVLPDGSSYQYDKRHTFTLADEHLTYASGTERLVVSFRDWKICPLVCYDLRFPVWSRNTEDYDLLIYVANWPASRVDAWDILLKARAIENMSYCIGVNRTGQDGKKLDYLGHSAVYDSLGKRISGDNEDFEGVHCEEVVVDKRHLSQIRSELKFLQDRDHFTLH